MRICSTTTCPLVIKVQRPGIERVLTLKPQHAGAHNNRGLTLVETEAKQRDERLTDTRSDPDVAASYRVLAVYDRDDSCRSQRSGLAS